MSALWILKTGLVAILQIIVHDATMQKKKVVLASSSPRRRELLEAAGVLFVIDPANIPEDMTAKLPAKDLVQKLALEKAQAVALRYPDAIVIGADTVVSIGKFNWSKPENEKEARMMLGKLSGKTHHVWTGFAIIDTKKGKSLTRAVSSAVTLLPFTKKEIDRQVKTGEALEGAGGYMIQKGGAALIKKIDGDYTNIIGLPLAAVLSELKKMGVRS